MDLKSFYKKIDVDSIKNKLPPLPQIKLPKIKSRKIFKSSREDISQQQQQQQMPMGGPPMTPQSLPPPPPSAFIDRTPTRISTVSSLMNINYGFQETNPGALSTYRTASTFEEEHCPDRLDHGDHTASGNAATRFGDRCRKTYKDFSEFKLKNIFAKKTIVKKTDIQVDIYARQYERELKEEQELENELDERASVYEFEFKEARRRLSRSSGSISPPDSLASGVPSPLRSELGRLQRNASPPSLLTRRRNAIDEPMSARLQKSMSDESAGEPPRKPNRSSLWGIAEKESGEETAEGRNMSYRAGLNKLKGFRKSRKENASGESDSNWNLKNIRNRFASEDSGSERKSKSKTIRSQESLDAVSDQEKKGWSMRNIHLRQTEPSERNAEQQPSSPEGKFDSIKQSIKRLKQRKPRQDTSEDSETEQNEGATGRTNVSDQLKAGLRRLRLRERSFSFDEEEDKTPQATTSKLRDWKKSFKVKRQNESVTDDDGPPSAPPPGRSSTLLRKLNHIRSRKIGSQDENDDESGDHTQSDDQQKQKTRNFEKLEHARDKAMKKVNAQVQKIKMYRAKSRDSIPEANNEKPRRIQKANSDDHSGGVVAELPMRTTPVLWATNRAISESLDSDDEGETPRVLLHQDNSDQYESTLIIAVTRPAPPAPPLPSTIIREIIPTKTRIKPSPGWIPNKNAVSSFLEMTPSPPQSKHLDINRGHFRKRSMDSNDSDSWIPDNFRNKSATSSTSAGLNIINEKAEPWKVHSVFSEEKLYKTKSIDIFSNHDGGAFVDFDDELKNVPVRRIAANSVDSLDKSFGESTDEDDDDDNSSRITRLKRPSPMISTTQVAIETVRSDSMDASDGSSHTTKKGQIGNSQESLDANFDENEELSSDDDEEPPDMAPSPPPSFSPPPPPLPLRKPPRSIPVERNDSMVRLAKPLVKQASLRRHFSEEIEPSDLGKVNKLISRFEKNPTTTDSVQRGQTTSDGEVIAEEDDDEKVIKQKDEGVKNGNKKRPAPVPKLTTARSTIEDANNNNNRPQGAASPDIVLNKALDIAPIQSPISVYGSPIGSVCLSERTCSEYGSPIGMPPYATSSMENLHAIRRLSIRSSLRDDDTFYSFESDEENNLYSFGDSSSTRYTIEI